MKILKEQLHVLLITTKTGGVGLNLVHTQLAILLEPHWNPSTLEQAKNRIWRLNQPEQTEVITLQATNSIEKRVFQVMTSKKQLAEQMFKKQVPNFVQKFIEEQF